MDQAGVTLEKAPQGAIVLEDQDGRPVSIWHPDMDAFDRLPESVRQYMTQMINPPPARNVLASVQVFGAATTLNELRTIDLEEKLKAKAA